MTYVPAPDRYGRMPYRRCGRSGAWISAAMPNLATVADELCFIKSMHTTQVNHAPPFIAGTDYTKPAAGQAVVAVYCGASANCTGSVPTLYQSEIDVYVYYGFSDLNILGGGITITGSSRATTSW